MIERVSARQEGGAAKSLRSAMARNFIERLANGAVRLSSRSADQSTIALLEERVAKQGQHQKSLSSSRHLILRSQVLPILKYQLRPRTFMLSSATACNR